MISKTTCILTNQLKDLDARCITCDMRSSSEYLIYGKNNGIKIGVEEVYRVEVGGPARTDSLDPYYAYPLNSSTLILLLLPLFTSARAVTLAKKAQWEKIVSHPIPF